ncbi:MAG: divalent-cation tolerance protein CutA [Cyanobacteria bacterium P01_G01_bin.38]
MEQLGIVLVTASSEAEAKLIASALVEARLAACVTTFPVHSVYRWQDKIHHDSEFQLVIKTDLTLFSALSTKVSELHSYDVPEIVAIAITNGSAPYLSWMKAQTAE